MTEEYLRHLILVEPDIRYAAACLEMAEDFHAAGEAYYAKELPLIRENFPVYVERLRSFALGQDLPQGNVPANEFWLLDPSTGNILGRIRLRHTLNPYLLERGGNIGYCIRPGARRRGCGTRMLALLLEKLRSLKWQRSNRLCLNRVLVTCAVDNTGSARIIEANGGVLENRVWSQGELISRYWIDLKTDGDGHDRD